MLSASIANDTMNSPEASTAECISPESSRNGRNEARRQRRVALACQRCKTRKQRCDGAAKCSSCLKTGNECIYVVNQPAGTTNHIKALEERVAELETSLAFYGASDVGDDHFRIAKLMPQGDASEADRGNEVFVAVRDLSLAASGHYVGGTSSIGIGRILNYVVQSQQPATQQSEVLEIASPEDPSPRSMSDARLEQMITLANMDDRTADRLVQGWHRHIATRYPIIHTSRLQSLHSNRTRLTDSYDKCILNLIYAVSGRWLESSGEAGAYFFSDKHFDAAYNDIGSVLKLRDTRSLDYLLLMTLYCTRAPRDPGAWTYIGLAVRLCIELGFHRKHHEQIPTLQNELEKRRFWTAYFLERDICIAIGRPFSLSDHDIDADLPLDVDEDLADDESLVQIWQQMRSQSRSPQKTSSLTPFIHRLRLKRIESEIQHTVYRVDQVDEVPESTIMSFLSRLEQWKSSIPPSAKTYKPRQQSLPYDGLEFFTIHLHRCTRFLLYPKLTTSSPNMHYLKLCAEACSGVISDYKKLHLVFPVGFSALSIQSVFLAGLTLIYCAWLSPPNFSDFDISLTDCQLLLYVIAERYPSAKKYRDIFERLRTAIRELMQAGNHQPGHPVPSLALDPSLLQQDFADLLGHESMTGSWPAYAAMSSDFHYMINTMTGNHQQSMTAFTDPTYGAVNGDSGDHISTSGGDIWARPQPSYGNSEFMDI